MYIFTKDPLPIDVEFFILRTLDRVSPGLSLIETYQECVLRWNYSAKLLQDDHVSDEEDLKEEFVSNRDSNVKLSGNGKDENGDEVVEEHCKIDGEENIDDENNIDYRKDDGKNSEIGNEDGIIAQELEKEEENDELFEREFSRLMHDSLDSRRVDKKTPVFDAPIPTLKQTDTLRNSGGNRTGKENRSQEKIDSENSVQFTVLVKKGNKQQVIIEFKID